MASQVMRITLKAYDHELVDSSSKKIIETVKKNGSQVKMCIRDSIEAAENGKEVIVLVELRARFDAVSYTHLDVYKRQYQGCKAPCL